jgi:hypothetical protein
MRPILRKIGEDFLQLLRRLGQAVVRRDGAGGPTFCASVAQPSRDDAPLCYSHLN